MIEYLRELRLIPIAAVASACLLALVAADLLLDRNASEEGPAPAVVDATTVIHAAPGVPLPDEAKRSWAQQMFNFPASTGAPPASAEITLLPSISSAAADKGNNNDIITGSVSETPESKTPEAKPPEAKNDKGKAGAAGPAAPADKSDKDGKPTSAGKDGKGGQGGNASRDNPPGNVLTIPPPGTHVPSAAERAILERLQERREELDKRSRELDIREGLIAEAEKRVEAKLAEIKEAKAQLAIAVQQRDAAEAARLKGLVTMYENMKPRDAAKIFDHLDASVLMEVAAQINPRAMSEILALMSPDSAERLTVELASRAKAAVKDANADLPKIEGRPTAQQ
jgi:flagellar motility protein MotE (MotC chaperone)